MLISQLVLFNKISSKLIPILLVLTMILSCGILIQKNKASESCNGSKENVRRFYLTNYPTQGIPLDYSHKDSINSKVLTYCKENNITLDTFGYLKIPIPDNVSVISYGDSGIEWPNLVLNVELTIEIKGIKHILGVSVGYGYSPYDGILPSDTFIPHEKKLSIVRETFDKNSNCIYLDPNLNKDFHESRLNENYDLFSEKNYFSKIFYWVNGFGRIDMLTILFSLRTIDTYEYLNQSSEAYNKLMDCIVNETIFVFIKE